MWMCVYGGLSESSWSQTRGQSPVSVVSVTRSRLDVKVDVRVLANGSQTSCEVGEATWDPAWDVGL